jgi:hypothetical protein
MSIRRVVTNVDSKRVDHSWESYVDFLGLNVAMDAVAAYVCEHDLMILDLHGGHVIRAAGQLMDPPQPTYSGACGLTE